MYEPSKNIQKSLSVTFTIKRFKNNYNVGNREQEQVRKRRMGK